MLADSAVSKDNAICISPEDFSILDAPRIDCLPSMTTASLKSCYQPWSRWANFALLELRETLLAYPALLAESRGCSVSIDGIQTLLIEGSGVGDQMSGLFVYVESNGPRGGGIERWLVRDM